MLIICSTLVYCSPLFPGYCAFVDAEHALDPALAEAIGVKTDNLLLSQPDCGEQALGLVDTLIRSGSVDVVVVDSVSKIRCYKFTKYSLFHLLVQIFGSYHSIRIQWNPNFGPKSLP